MSRRGFSLLELLIATAIAALVTAAVAMVVPSLQAFFEQTPAVLDMQQRGRTAVDAIAQAVRGADRVRLLDRHPSQEFFRQLMTVTPATNPAQAVVAEDQAGPAGELRLAVVRCPGVPEVCGFERHSIARIADGSGRFDVFTVGSIDAAAWSISPRLPLDQPYAADATVVEVDALTFRLDRQPDGSFTLVRETAAGAVQPIVDRVSELRFAQTFDGHGVDVTIALQRHGSRGDEITRRFAMVTRNTR